MAAIGSRPIRAHHSSHVHASFLYGIELCCIRRKKLVYEKSCTRNHVRRSSFLYKLTCTSFLYMFLDCVSPPLHAFAQRTQRIFYPCVTALASLALLAFVASKLNRNHLRKFLVLFCFHRSHRRRYAYLRPTCI